MADQWLAMEAAAAVLGISYRTLQRRIKSGMVRSREVEGGGREILVDVPEEQFEPAPPRGGESAATAGQAQSGPEADPAVATAMNILARQGERQVQLVAGAIGVSDRLGRVYESSMAQAGKDLRRARMLASAGWAAVGMLLVGAAGGAYYGATQWTETKVKATVTQEQYHQSLAELEAQQAQLETRQAELQALTVELAEARTKAEVADRFATDHSGKLDEAGKKIDANQEALLTAREQLAAADVKLMELAAARAAIEADLARDAGAEADTAMAADPAKVADKPIAKLSPDDR